MTPPRFNRSGKNSPGHSSPASSNQTPGHSGRGSGSGGARMPLVLLLDVSYSMKGKPLRAVNDGYAKLLGALNEDSSVAEKVDISVITFASDAVLDVPFTSARHLQPREFLPRGATEMGEAVSLALREIHNQIRNYESAGLRNHHPWVFVFTDGGPSDRSHPAYDRLRAAEERGLVVFPMGVGSRVDWSFLNCLSHKQDAMALKGLNFKELFQWLADELRRRTEKGIKALGHDEVPPRIPGGLIEL